MENTKISEAKCKGPLSFFYFLKRNLQNQKRLKGPLSIFLGAMVFFFEFFCVQRVHPSILLKHPFVISNAQSYIRTFERPTHI